MSNDASPDPDRQLVEECQAVLAARSAGGRGGSLDGPFETLYERFCDRVYNVCFRITGNATDALDASQETFGTVCRKLGDFRYQSRFSSWVYRIAVNASIDLRRRTRARRSTSIESVGDEVDDDGLRFDVTDETIEMPAQSASRRELESEIQRAITRLSPKLRAITVLRYIESLSYEEISETLKISLGTVKSRLARAHRALDRELTPLLDKHYLG
jgi:RNA polymerase sigma-70 factor (ECF subfamily)